MGAKFDKMDAAADPEVLKKFKAEVLDVNERADFNVDAAKLVRNKLKSFLSAQ